MHTRGRTRAPQVCQQKRRGLNGDLGSATSNPVQLIPKNAWTEVRMVIGQSHGGDMRRHVHSSLAQQLTQGCAPFPSSAYLIIYGIMFCKIMIMTMIGFTQFVSSSGYR